MKAKQTEKKSDYDKLTPQRKQLVDMVLENLKNGTGLWSAGWEMSGMPESAITGKRYRGINNFFLNCIAMGQGYRDNRWATFKQIEDRGWRFKTDEEGNSLAKGKGASIEFFELRDKNTGLTFDKNSIVGMTEAEKDEYFDDNVRAIRKYYRVFNGDIIDGIPEKDAVNVDAGAKIERAENLLQNWSESECKIIYGGRRAYYSVDKDEVHLPKREDFYSNQEFYSTALHEISHSTAHPNRLNRDIKNKFGSSEYAEEELRAEIASMFLEQDFELQADKNHIENNSAYIKAWQDEITENPNTLFTAITDADRIAKFVVSKEKERKKDIEHYAIVESENEYGEAVYSVYMTAEHGQTVRAINYAFSSREALLAEFKKMQGLPLWRDSDFVEVSEDELRQISLNKAKTTKSIEEKSDIYKPPSEIVAKDIGASAKVNMKERGIETLTRMNDREVVEKASKSKNGDKFLKLYNGESVLGNEHSDERSLMSRLAMYSDGEEQALRIFKSSGQYREEKPNSFYELMANESMQFVAGFKERQNYSKSNNTERNYSNANAKT